MTPAPEKTCFPSRIFQLLLGVGNEGNKNVAHFLFRQEKIATLPVLVPRPLPWTLPLHSRRCLGRARPLSRLGNKHGLPGAQLSSPHTGSQPSRAPQWSLPWEQDTGWEEKTGKQGKWPLYSPWRAWSPTVGGRPQDFGQGGLPLRPGVLVPVTLAMGLQHSSRGFLGWTAPSGRVAVLM